jgi:uncharacterized membrane protein required for colicin V production
MINGLDILILTTFLAVIAVGFFNGVTKVMAAILGIYFASVVAAAFYEPVTHAAREHLTSMNQRTGYLFFFVLLFLIFAAIFSYVIARWLGRLKLPRRIEILDNVGGAALGVIVSMLAVTLAAMLMVVLIQALNQTFGVAPDGAVGEVRRQINQSQLVPVFLRLAPYFTDILRPWFPSGLPPILSGGVEA